MKTKTIVALASTVATFATGIATSASAETTLRIFADEYRPVYFLNDAKEVSGPAAQIVREAAERAGVALEFEYRPFKRAVTEVEKNANSCFVGLWHTEAREDKFAWAGNILTDGYAFFALADSDIALSSVEDSFAHATGVAAGWGSTEDLRAAGHPKLQEVPDDMLNLKKLQHGRVDFWVTGTLTGPYAAKQAGIEIKQALALQEVPLDLACNLNSDPAAVSAMAAAITELREAGRVQELLDQVE